VLTAHFSVLLSDMPLEILRSKSNVIFKRRQLSPKTFCYLLSTVVMSMDYVLKRENVQALESAVCMHIVVAYVHQSFELCGRLWFLGVGLVPRT
jgi:hypothetical protein